MKLLVTGGAGFIGSNFIRHVLREHADDRVVNLDKLTYAGNPANLADIQRDPRYAFVQGDICDAALVRETLRGVDAVVNFAAESHVDRSLVEPDGFTSSGCRAASRGSIPARTNRCCRRRTTSRPSRSGRG